MSEKVLKGEPKGSQMEPESEPESFEFDTLARHMQESFIFRSNWDP